MGTAGADEPRGPDPQRLPPDWPTVMLRVAGAGLLIATAAIHLDLYVTGYRTIPRSAGFSCCR